MRWNRTSITDREEWRTMWAEICDGNYERGKKKKEESVESAALRDGLFTVREDTRESSR